jgi:hypothetical protein
MYLKEYKSGDKNTWTLMFIPNSQAMEATQMS